jgi:hypothetical protein
MKSGVYAITNTANGWQYIGSSKDMKARWRIHKNFLERGAHPNFQLQAAYGQYGANAFTFTVLEYVDREHLRERESHWMGTLMPAYNIEHVTGKPFIGDIMNDAQTALADRFWQQVDMGSPDECWLWTSRINKHGYGQFYHPDTARTIGVHRVAWEFTHGPIPQGMHVLHRCDVRNCVNPAHLFLGTNADNMRDKVMKDRVQRLKGAANGRAKLLELEVKNIRRMYASGRYTQAQLGRIFDVSQSTIEHILAGKRWQHVR